MGLVNQSVREHLQRLEDEKFEAEAEAYEQMHPELVKKYLGQYVAIHEGRVVGHDPDFETLFLAMNEKYEGIPIFFTKLLRCQSWNCADQLPA
jgi:phosphohistidine phosphatase SixA